MLDKLIRFSALCAAFFVVASSAHALPWDKDMFSQQSVKASEGPRAPAEGTIPVGQEPFRMTTDEAGKTLQNTQKFTTDSVWRGRRMWNANCQTCHGTLGDGKGPVGPQMSVPDILTDFYKARTDGYIFGVIMNGGANMPRYGYKFSEDTIWDVVNYVRFLQGRNAEGIERPK